MKESAVSDPATDLERFEEENRGDYVRIYPTTPEVYRVAKEINTERKDYLIGCSFMNFFNFFFFFFF